MKIALITEPSPTRALVAAPPAPEAWTTLDTPAALRLAQEALGAEHEVVLITNDTQLEDRVLACWPDMVLTLTAERTGPELLERWHLPYAGSSWQTLQRCLDRSASRRVLRKNGLPTPVFLVVQAPEEVRSIDRFPLLVKPLYERDPAAPESAAVVHNSATLLTRVQWVLDTYDQPALVETSLPGRDIIVALLGNGNSIEALPLTEPDAMMLPAESLAVVAGDTPGENTAVTPPEPRYRCPAEISAALAQHLTELARQAFLALECSDFCSVSLRLDAEAQPYILDVNPNPPLLPCPDSPSAFLTAVAAARMTYADLIRHIWQIACQRYGLAL
jgi:D-alanine-D-alanine ligase